MSWKSSKFLPRQFSLKYLLIFIAVFCLLVFWAVLSWRQGKYLERYEMHRTKSTTTYYFEEGVYGLDNVWIKSCEKRQERYQDYHRRMAEKYKRAADHPCISVAADPPEPPDPMATDFDLR